MSKNIPEANLLEKIVSVLSYITAGIVGFIWLLLAFFMHKKLRYFLRYNITQSIIISLLLAIFGYLTEFIFTIISKIPFLDIVAAVLNLIINFKVLTVYPLQMSFSVFEIFIYLITGYIIFGVILGRIFYIPVLTKAMIKLMKNYQ